MSEMDPTDLVRILNEQAGFPPRPDLRGGSANAGPVIAVLDSCWCGQHYRHDWPGKEDGAPHPRYPR